MTYSKEDKERILNTVCARLSNGEAVRVILDEDDMPTEATFYKWVDKNDEMLKQYIGAREARETLIFEEMLTIADDKKGDHNRDRLRLDTRKWMLGKMNSTKYGDKVHNELSGKVKIENITGMEVK